MEFSIFDDRAFDDFFEAGEFAAPVLHGAVNRKGPFDAGEIWRLLDPGARDREFSVPVTYRFHRSRHFAQRVDLRNLSDEEAKQVVYYGKKTATQRTGKHGGKVFLFEKCVDGVTLKVVAEVKDSECWLMTSYECK